MSLPSRVFLARLAGLPVFDPLGDPVGRVRDLVVTFRVRSARPRVIGLVLEVPARRRVFVPMSRVTSIDASQVITTGLVNMRRFEQRHTETLALAELLERQITVTDDDGDFPAIVEDLAVDIQRKEWQISKVFCRKTLDPPSRRLRLTRRRGDTVLVDVEQVAGLQQRDAQQPADLLLQTYESLNDADFAEVLHELEPKRRSELAVALDDGRLAVVLGELPEDDQVGILRGLDPERAADVLEMMEPDDATDLLAELPADQQEYLLDRMEPDEAAPLRRLLSYDEDTAGGLMTSEPVILGPESTIAEALARVRREELPTTLATTVFVCRPPLETPTGKYLGLVHIQKLLREPPHASIGTVVENTKGTDPMSRIDAVHRQLAAYDLIALPVVDEVGRLVGAVTVDDVLDHILPDDWREERDEVTHG
ncbi:MAG: magnesium transporter [Actinomycetales bacterium]|nr:MAG: magnesium transporter [Actinomycetales bacterium]